MLEYKHLFRFFVQNNEAVALYHPIGTNQMFVFEVVAQEILKTNGFKI